MPAMPDFGQQVIGAGVNMGVGRALDAAGVNSPVPIPNFYNPRSDHPFRDSQLNQMLHGNGRAWQGYGRRALGSAIDTGLMATPLGLPNMLARSISGLFGRHWSLGGLLSNIGNHQSDPTGTVGGSPATTGPEGTTGGGVTIDPWTGQAISGGGGLPNYMPNFTGGQGYSAFGPYAGGYQGLPDQGNNPQLPDFGNYSDQFMQLADENGDGHLSHEERRDATDYRNNYALGQGVTNFMVNGSPVINGVRTTDMNGLVFHRRDMGN